MAQILVIDDDRDVREILKEMLRIKGYSVVATSDGEDALKLIESERFDLVLTDLVMPKVSGWDIIRRVKRISRSIPVILISGWSDRISKRDLTENQADLMLSKPVVWKDLLTAVSGLLGEVEQPPHIPSSEIEPDKHPLA